ncbi:MAG TPA: heavy metal-associated domain-containing protein [Nocardioidaceae bacterium]|nr:heavy metal-associated domain-containing protein [Nocardioidaceae bacterium]
MTTLQFQVNGLTTETQAERLAAAIRNLLGVTAAAVDSRTGTVSVEALGPDLNPIFRAATRAGYELASRPSRGGSWAQRWLGTRTWQVSLRPRSVGQEQHRVGILPASR